MYEASVKICNDVEEWLDKRSQIFGQFNELFTWQGHKEFVTKRKRRPLFYNGSKKTVGPR